MTKQTKAAPAVVTEAVAEVVVEAPAAPVAPEEPRVTLEHATARMLDTLGGKSYPPLYAFRMDEERAGRSHDTQAAFEARYTEFLNRRTA